MTGASDAIFERGLLYPTPLGWALIILFVVILAFLLVRALQGGCPALTLTDGCRPPMQRGSHAVKHDNRVLPMARQFTSSPSPLAGQHRPYGCDRVGCP